MNFFEMQNLYKQNIKSLYWKLLMKPVKHLSCSSLLTDYNWKKVLPKSFTLDVWKGCKLYQLLLWWILLLPTINIYPKYQPLFNNSFSYSTIKLRRIKIFKLYRFCQNSLNDAYVKGWQGPCLALIASLWRIAYEYRYVTGPLNHSIKSPCFELTTSR